MNKPLQPIVTDHAVIRYLERVYEMDIAKLRAEILSPQVRAALKLGASAVNVGEFRYVLEGNTVITIHPRRVNMKADDLKRFTPGKRP